MGMTLYPAEQQIVQPNPLAAWQAGANIAGTQANALKTLAQVPLTQAQTQQQLIQNQLIGARLGLFNSLTGQGAAPPPPAQGGGTIAGGTAGATGTGAPVATNALGAAAGGPGASGTAPGGAGSGLSYGGTTEFGVSLPRNMVAWAILNGQPVSALVPVRNQMLLSRLETATTPDAFNAITIQNLRDGLISPQQFQKSYGHFELRDQIARALASPDTIQSTGASLAGQGLQPNPNGNGYAVLAAKPQAAGEISAAQAIGTNANANITTSPTSATSLSPGVAAARGIGAPVPTTGSLLAPAQPATLGQYAAMVPGVEGGVPGGGGPPGSSAVGPAQINAATRATLGVSAGQAGTAAGAAADTARLGAINASILQGAGQPVTTGSLGMAHFLGGNGAVAVMRLPANTPIAQAFPPGPNGQPNPVIAANPWVGQLATTGQIAQRFASEYGTRPVQIGPQGAGGAAGAGPAASAAGVAPGAPPIPGFVDPGPGFGSGPAGAAIRPTAGGGATISSTLTPGGVAQQTAQVKQWTEAQNEYATEATGANTQNYVIGQMQAELRGFTPGLLTNPSQQFLRLANTVTAPLGHPIQSVADWQAFNKNAIQLVSGAVQAVSPRAAFQEVKFFQNALPNAAMTQGGIDTVLSELQGLNDWRVARAAAAAKWTGPQAAFNAQWTQTAPIFPFMVRRMSAADATAWAQNMAKTPAGKTYLRQIMGQMKTLDGQGVFAAAPAD